MAYTKNSVKLLTLINEYENHTVLYTEFDGNYSIGDKLYIMVIDSGSTDYVLDSFVTTGTTYKSIGYELLGKEGNKLILDIDYSTLILTITGLTENNCYIGRVYIKKGSIISGTINGSLLYNIILQPTSNLSLKWWQGILVNTPSGITNINFNTNNLNNLILKSELLSNNSINSYYTINNYNNGLSIINLSDDFIQLSGCNIYAGIFNNCSGFTTTYNSITNGILNNCFIGKTYQISGGEFIDCRLENYSINWLNGKWNSNWTGVTDSDNPFKTRTWTNGTWVNGIFPNIAGWMTGRFMKGTFNGVLWYDGSFGTENSTTTDTIFKGSTWNDGNFNGGEFSGSTWEDGNFYGGEFNNSTWNNGNFYNGLINNESTWNNGNFNNGLFSGSTWNNGEFNDGLFSGSTWNYGNFNNGGIIGHSIWKNGYFNDGKFELSNWSGGTFNKGSMFTSKWLTGNLYFGLMNDIDWSGGTWFNGIANNVRFYNVIWKNGIFNYGQFYKGKWYNGSFNLGSFSGGTDSTWYGGNFYFGEFGGTWSGGTFYTGKIQTYIPQKYIIGREFIQYNKSGLFSNRYSTTLRLPAKSRF